MENIKDLKELSNSEIKIYQEQLTNIYEKIKQDIQKKVDELDKLDVEYNRTVSELNKRKNFK